MYMMITIYAKPVYIKSGKVSRMSVPYKFFFLFFFSVANKLWLSEQEEDAKLTELEGA